MEKPKNNAAVRRSWRIYDLLSARYFDGMSNKELAEAVGTSATNITRDMQTLESIGMAQKMENGHWGLTSRALVPSQRFAQQYETISHRMAEAHRSIMAGAAR